MARTLLTAFQHGLPVSGPTAASRKSIPPRSTVVKSVAAAKHQSRLLPVRALPKVTVVVKPSSIIHPVVRVPVQRPRGKASALKCYGEQESCFRFASRHSAEAAVKHSQQLDNRVGDLAPVIECCKICRTIACSVMVCPCCFDTCV